MKRRYTVTKEYDLANMSFEDVLETAWEIAKQRELEETGKNLTFELIALRTGRSKSAIHQYFTNPDYNPSPRFVPKLCEALGNDLIIDWLCIQRGGLFVRVDASKAEDMNIVAQVSKMSDSNAAVLSAVLESIKDGKLTQDELKKIAKRLRDHVRIVEQSLICADESCTTGRA